LVSGRISPSKKPPKGISVRFGQKYIPFGDFWHCIQCFIQWQSIEFGCRFFYMKMVILKRRHNASYISWYSNPSTKVLKMQNNISLQNNDVIAIISGTRP